jgi:acyl-CoA synthetase (AMP-forming)/AMP-acid ligase II/acyl carrier protein
MTERSLMLTTPRAPTIVALLHAQAHDRGAATVYRYLEDGESETRSITFAELELEARAVAARLQETAAPGDRALILAEDAIDFISAFTGCQLARVIAVPVSPPFPSQRGRRVETLRAIARNCGARIVLTSWPREFQARVESVAPELADLRWIAVDDVPGDAVAEFRPRPVRSDDVAFLQYTSGSTSTPKGVVVTHHMLVHNEAYIQRATRIGDDDVQVSWLPLFHDMGLIGAVLQPLYSGMQTVFMPPSAFARRPLNWLQAISRYRATVTAAPDSAYRLCVEKITPQERAGLDLRSWRLALNGAEPLAASTLDAFATTFGPCGFDRRSLYPTFGLAECTLMATGSEPQAGARTLTVHADALHEGRVVTGGDKVLIGCGKAIMHRRVEIVDPSTSLTAEPGAVGEIWLAGPDVAGSYWDLPEESERVFKATLADTGDGPFLRTGDLGFIRDGELYVTGRLKDVIIVAGRNHYPQDIEATVLSVHGSLVDGACTAFSVQRDGRELVVVVAEMQTGRLRRGVDVEALARRITSAVASEHGIAVAEVVLANRKSVPRTSSGKLQRTACRAAYERGEVSRAQTYTLDGDVLALPTAQERRRTLRRLLVEQIEAVLRVSSDSVDTTVPFQQLGLDSLMTAELRERLEAALGERLSPTMFFAHPTTDRLVERLLDQMAPVVTEPPPPAPPREEGAGPEPSDDLAELDERRLTEVLSAEIGMLEAAMER